MENKGKKSFNISGELSSVNEHSTLKDLSNPDKSANKLSNYMVANLLFDARLTKGYKGFINYETQYVSQTRNTTYLLREMFLDFNISNRVYFRTGKQILQWGRCYLWNPTDLINVEKKMFIQKIGYREGAYGIKMHIPSGTKWNIYSFIDTGNADNTDNIAGALKFEFLYGRKTEMAFETWSKKGYKTVYGYDFSTRLSGIDLYGESSISYGDNYDRMKEESGILLKYRVDNEWVNRTSIGFSRAFDAGDINDRIRLTGEFYYNQAGYADNLAKDESVYGYDIPTLIPINGAPVLKTAGTKREFLFYNNLFEMNNYARYYAAVFISFSRFIITDMALNVNLISNLVDNSCILTTGISYQNINDFRLNFNIYSFLGKEAGEYNLFNSAPAGQLTFGIVF